MNEIVCERCGAIGHGNVFCIQCLRWMKRVRRSNFARLLIKLAERRIRAYAKNGGAK
jgi:hypothetical protein